MKSNNLKDVDGDLTILFKVVDKLEKRIANLKKFWRAMLNVLES